MKANLYNNTREQPRDDEARKRKAEYNKEYRKRVKADPKKYKKERARLAAYKAKVKEQHKNVIIQETSNTNTHRETTTVAVPHTQQATTILVERVADTSGEPQVHSHTIHASDFPTPVSRYDYTTWIDYTRDETYDRAWISGVDYFDTAFFGIRFDVACSVCHRLWPDSTLRDVTPACRDMPQKEFPGEDVCRFQVCNNCSHMLRKKTIPNMSRSNGFKYPPKPTHLAPLDPVGLRLVSPRLPFMHIRRLRMEGGYGMVGLIVNVPVDVDALVSCLPRKLSDDCAINVNIKKSLSQIYVPERLCK